jgi:hypothetical protein
MNITKIIPTIEGLTTLDYGNSIVNPDIIRGNIDNFNQCISSGSNSNVCLNYYLNALNNSNLKGNIIYDTSNNYIKSNYNNIINERSELEAKMKELYKSNDSIFNSDFRSKYDATMLTGIIWSVLAGCVLYYTFTKL